MSTTDQNTTTIKGKGKKNKATSKPEAAAPAPDSNPIVTVTSLFNDKGEAVTGQYLLEQKQQGADKQRQCHAVLAVLASLYGYVKASKGDVKEAIKIMVYGSNGARNMTYIGHVLDHMGQGVLRSTGKGNIKGTKNEITSAYPKGVLRRVPHKYGDEKYVASQAEAYASKAVQECIASARIPSKVDSL